MMVVSESFVTRKPLEFTLIVLFILLILLLPVYFLTKDSGADLSSQEFVAQSYSEVNFLLGDESDLSEKDKRNLFRLDYEDRTVQWAGTLLVCEPLDALFRVVVDQDDDGEGEVIFTAFTDCTALRSGSTVNYKVKLIDWHTDKFVGKEGEVL